MVSTLVRTFEFQLPIGHIDEDGQLHKVAVLRKMTGREEAIMADKSNRNNGARMITELLSSCLVQIGTIEKPGNKIVQSLYSADRHYLLIKLREITFGSEIEGNYSCPTCHTANVLRDDLTELEVTKLDDGELPQDVVVELEDGYVDRDGEVYTSMVFRYPVGSDEEKTASAIRQNASHGKNALMARCLKVLGDMPEKRIQALGTAIFDQLTLSDRALVDKALNNGGPGIKMRRHINCVNCGREFDATLDMSNFLSPS
ncbi:hypothetical protein ACKFKG_30105 [Phormidesmis sp. 146-35]